MPQLIHLTDLKRIPAIRKNGILPGKMWGKFSPGVFVTPVSRDYFRTHQWLREMRRRGIRTIAAVQFREESSTEVEIGRYYQDHLTVELAEAIRIFDEHESGMGLQIIIPRVIEPLQIKRIYVPRQVVGWRYYPEAHGRAPCPCEYCQRGRIKGKRLRRRFGIGDES